MKAKTISILILLTVAMAVPTTLAKKAGQEGKSNTGHLYLYEKDPSDWSIVDGGAWGKLTYKNGTTFDFVFNGHGVTPRTSYSLIYYADPWGASPQGLFIGSSMSNKGGQIHVQGSPDLGTDLPMTHDINSGAKIWLVLSSHIVVNSDGTISFTDWDATKYLFEYDLIIYDDTEVP